MRRVPSMRLEAGVRGTHGPLHSQVLPVAALATGPPHSAFPSLATVARGTSCGLVRNHPLDLGFVRLAHDDLLGQLALALGVLRSKDVAQVRVAALDLSGSGLLEALGSSAMRFKFRHKPPLKIPA